MGPKIILQCQFIKKNVVDSLGVLLNILVVLHIMNMEMKTCYSVMLSSSQAFRLARINLSCSCKAGIA